MFKKKKKQKNDDSFLDESGDKVLGSNEAENDLQQLQTQPEWIDEEEPEGQLSVDVYEEGDTIIVKSTVAGVEPEDIDVSIVNDMLTVRGKRKEERTSRGREYFFQECFWGSFSRSIILPVDVDVKRIDATIKNGILTVILPKLKTKEKKSIKIKDENS